MRKIVVRITLLMVVVVIVVVGVASSYVYWLSQKDSAQHEEAAGSNSVWCNNRYLPSLDAQHEVFNKQHLNIAKEGYLYALLGTFVLQKDNSEGAQHSFTLPERVVKNIQLHELNNDSGFEANTFEIFSLPDLQQRTEIVITFTGSNDSEDWMTNLSTNQDQYEQAVHYVAKVARFYPDMRFTVTGFSLGGGLAAHVTKNNQTASLIAKAWVFNPSPKIWADSSSNPKIWQAATEHDILKIVRHSFFRFLPGISAIGAPENQTAENYYLIDSNPVFAHYRWALARNILHVADLAFYKESGGVIESSEPLEILRQSQFHACNN